MAQQACESIRDKDEEYRKAIGEFYRIYNSLKKKRALRMHGHVDREGALIEIWEYKNGGEIKTICRVNAENDTDCHRMAAEQLKWEAEKTKKVYACGNSKGA